MHIFSVETEYQNNKMLPLTVFIKRNLFYTKLIIKIITIKIKIIIKEVFLLLNSLRPSTKSTLLQDYHHSYIT